jgi:hypothetical protein
MEARSRPRQERTVKILQIAASSRAGFRDWRGNEDRLKILLQLITHAQELRCDLLLLPAGFLYARNDAEKYSLVECIKIQVQAHKGVTVVGGIDVGRRTKKNLEYLVRRGQPLPFFVVVVGHQGPTQEFQQRSMFRRHATIDNAPDISTRTVVVRGANMLVLVCGEMFNHAMQERLTEAKLDLVVDATHSGMGTGLIQTLRRITKRARCPVFHSQHLASVRGSMHAVLADGQQASVPVAGNILPLDQRLPWVAATVRMV